MNSKASYLSYRETGYFSKLVSDYIDGAESLQPFLQFPADIEGVKKAIAARQNAGEVHREPLVSHIQHQYAGIDTSDKVRKNISSLINGNAYTICTAHQPNLFTGHMYFVYKVLHAIKLADSLSKEIPEAQFIPVFYMGSEDADIDELGQVTIEDKKLTWETNQKGAVGRMQVDEKLIALIKEIEGQLSVEAFGTEVIAMLKSCYQKGNTVEQATFLFVNELFKDFGLVILLPDNKSLKTLFKQTIRKELTEQFSSKAVSKTIDAFPAEYKVQAGGRDLNLFYLNDHLRERIEAVAGKFVIANTDISFTSDEIMSELESFPERFSPNVITRPLYQETILPNVAFIGGGAELAYWLELKQVFKEAGLAFPVLVLRNSFMVLTMKTIDKIEALGLSPKDFFEEQSQILGKLVAKRSTAKLSLENEKQKLTSLYSQIKDVSKAADTTLERHVEALCIQALHRITLLEKKLLKVEKRKFETEQRQISNIKTALFPNSTLQERVDNILPYYAKYGPGFLRSIYDSSLGLDMRFCLLSVK